MSTKQRGKYNSKKSIIILLYNGRDLQKKCWKIKILGLSNPSIMYPKDMQQRIYQKEKIKKNEKKQLILFSCHFYIEKGKGKEFEFLFSLN